MLVILRFVCVGMFGAAWCNSSNNSDHFNTYSVLVKSGIRFGVFPSSVKMVRV
jgi:hypothetical protein